LIIYSSNSRLDNLLGENLFQLDHHHWINLQTNKLLQFNSSKKIRDQ